MYHLPSKQLCCQKCGCLNGIRCRQHTAYVDDKENFGVFCCVCQIEEDEYWIEMWNEYYQAVGI